jgi:hypothetical protein
MSDSMKFTRRAGVIAFVGALFGIAVSLLLNAAYSLTPDGVGLAVPPWQQPLQQIAGPALTFSPALEVYHLYGRSVFLVFVTFVVGLYGLYASQRAFFDGRPPRLQAWGYRLAMAGFFLSLFGNIGDYWLSAGETLDFVAFLGGTILGLLLGAIGLVLFAIPALRSASLPRAAAYALILWFPFSIVLLLLGMQNLPASPLLALSLAWALVSATMVWWGSEDRVPHRRDMEPT